jgi:acyl carrier protein
MLIDVSQKPSVTSRIKTILIEKLGCTEQALANNPSFANDLDVDSLDLCEIFMELEKEYGIKIPDEEAEKLTTVDAVILYVKKKTFH